MVDKNDVDIKRPPILYERTQEIIKKIEELTSSKLICYWNSVNGSICQNDVVAFYEILKDIPVQKNLSIFIKSGGGDGKASLRIINLLRQHANKINAMIPVECASAGTMLVLGADQILMGPLAYLTAVDTSLTHDLSPIDKNNSLVSVSQDELSRVINLWNKEKKDIEDNPYKSLYQYIHPLVIGAVDRVSSLSIKLCKEILSFHMSDSEKINIISNHLNSGYPSHSYPITYTEAKKIGLDVGLLSKQLNDLMLQLNETYSEMGQRAYTDYDEFNYHDNEILNIIEGNQIQILYQVNKDYHYRSEERRWIPMNDLSGWLKTMLVDEKPETKKFFIR